MNKTTRYYLFKGYKKIAAIVRKQQLRGYCPEFPAFGASYPDARCLDGLLWDLDSDDDGYLTSGGDRPCPFCNSKQYVGDALENGDDIGNMVAHYKFIQTRYGN